MRVVAIVRSLQGDARRQRVLNYLRQQCDVEILEAGLPIPSKVLNYCLTVSGDRELWRERSKKNSFFFREQSKSIYRELGRLRPNGRDVLLFFEALYSAGFGTRFFRPYVVYEDSTSAMAMRRWPRWVPDSARTARYRSLERRHYREAVRIVTSNEAARQSVIADYDVPHERVINIGQGQDIDEGLLAGRAVPLSILFVGYEFERKGGPVLLRAFERVRRTYPAATLTIVGPELDVRQPGVTVLGRVADRRSLAQLYAQASIFVLPSVFDPMPHAALEAMSLRVPVVVSECCGTAELIESGRNGVLVRPDDAEQLASQITWLLMDERRQEAIGRAGAETIASECRWTTVSKALFETLSAASEAAVTMRDN